MYKFLLIDDSRVMRRMLQNTLKAIGYESDEFIEAVDGENALEQLQNVNFSVDVIFCDLSMPNLDGIGFLEALSARGLLAKLPVIVLTGDIRESRGREALTRGARKLISKPFTPDVVRGAVAEVLEERHRMSRR